MARESVFDRLSRTETVSSSGKRRVTPRGGGSTKSQTNSAAGRSRTVRSRKVNAAGSASKIAPALKEKPQPQCCPPKKTSIRLLCTNVNNPESDFSELSPSELNLTSSLSLFEEGEIGSRKIAREIIEALFKRDLKPGEQWDIDPAMADPVDDDINEEGEAFHAEKEATYDINSTASAKAIVRIMPGKKEVKVENYSYYVSD